MSHRSRRLLVLLTVLMLVALPGGLVGYFRWAADRELRAARAEATAADPGWQLTDLLAARTESMPPPDENAALLLAGLEASLRTLDTTALEVAGWRREDAAPNRLPSAVELQVLDSALAAAADPLAVVRRAADLPGGKRPITLPPEPDQSAVVEVMQSNWARAAANAAMLDAAGAAGRNDPVAATRGVRAGQIVALSLDDEPSAIGALVRVAVSAVAARSAERVLAWTEPTDGLGEVEEGFRKLAAAPIARSGLRGERAIYDQSMTALRAGGVGRVGAMVGLSQHTTDHAAGLRVLTRAIAELDEAPHRRKSVALLSDEVLGGNPPPLTKLLLPAVDKTLAACVRHEATMRVAATAIACERHRRRIGRWPASLAELPQPVPTDPFDGQSLRYRPTVDGVVLYSVGEDRVDEGGKPLARGEGGKSVGDVVFRLYNPAARRQPAPSAP